MGTPVSEYLPYMLFFLCMCHGGVEDGVGQLDGGEIEEMKQNKVQKEHSRLKSSVCVTSS